MRFSAKAAGASSRLARSVLASSTARFERRDLRARRRRCASSQACALGGDRREPPRRQARPRARAPAPRRAPRRAARAGSSISPRTAASCALELGRRRQAPRARARPRRARRPLRRGWRQAGSWLRSSADSAGRVAAGLALGRGVPVARGVGLALQLAPARARFGLGRRQPRDCLGFAPCRPRALGLDLGARGLQFGLDIGEPVLARRAAAPRRSAHWRQPRSRPSATGRLRARPAAGRA